MAVYHELGSSFGGCGTPSDRDRFYVSNPTSGRSQFLNASGSRQTGFHHSCTPSYPNKPKTTGHYLGNGEYVED